jgi:hypothetical protein
MPVEGLSGRVRTPRSMKAKLGYTKLGQRSLYPSDSDAFIAKREDGWSDDALKAYGAKEISDAATRDADNKPVAKPFAVGKTLRLMLPWEFDALHEDREIAVELLNRAWGRSKGLKCSGTGGQDQPGIAYVRDPAWIPLIEKATDKKAIDKGGRGHQVVCLGPDCPFWKTNADRNREASCHTELRIQAILLHPATDVEDPSYMKQLGWVEIASGSFNGAIDVQSGFLMIRGLVGRTAYIPFALRRVARTMFPEGKRVLKSTLMVDYDTDEVLRFGFGPPARAMLRPAVRRELLELATQEAQFQSFSDIIPRPALRDGTAGALPAHEEPAPETDPSLGENRDDAIARAAAESEAEDATFREESEEPPPGNAEPAARDPEDVLSDQEIDEVKVMCGGTPGDYASLEFGRELLREAHAHFGTWPTPSTPATAPPPWTRLQVRHRDFIRKRLAELEAERAGDPDDQPPEASGDGEPERRRPRAPRGGAAPAQERLL